MVKGHMTLWVSFMVFNATFNNISFISWWSVLSEEESGVPGESLSQVTDKLYHDGQLMPSDGKRSHDPKFCFSLFNLFSKDKLQN